jgi:hypothetical protein
MKAVYSFGMSGHRHIHQKNENPEQHRCENLKYLYDVISGMFQPVRKSIVNKYRKFKCSPQLYEVGGVLISIVSFCTVNSNNFKVVTRCLMEVKFECLIL